MNWAALVKSEFLNVYYKYSLNDEVKGERLAGTEAIPYVDQKVANSANYKLCSV